MPVISTTLKKVAHEKVRYIAKQEIRTCAGFVRHLIHEKIRAFEAEHGEIILPEQKEETDGP